MKTRLFEFGISAAFLIIAASLPAQVPQLINYQGRVVVGTTNFDGSGSFKFALVNATGTTAYWTNDGTHLDGTEPSAAVSLTVAKGLYSVLLGDTALINMTAVPASVFNNSDVRLRVWFDDGTHGSQQLSPDQRIASVGYAVMAGNVPDGAITSLKIANGAVGSTQLANGAVTSAQIDTTTVQKRISGSAPPGQFVTSINADGTVVAAGSPGSPFLLNGTSAYYNAGNVGIGTTDPYSPLQVFGNNDAPVLSIASGLNQIGNWNGIDFGYTYLRKAGIFFQRTDNYYAGSLNFAVNHAQDSSNVSLSDTKMTIDEFGNVGIGTTNPGTKLDILNSGGFSGIRVHNDGSNAAAGMIFQNTQAITEVGAGITPGSRFEVKDDVAAATRLLIDSSGNVGIGTTSPTQGKLQILSTSAGAATTGIALQNNSTTLGTEIGLDFATWSSFSTARIAAVLEALPAETAIAFSTHNGGAFGERVRIDHNGNVGIGKTNPGAPLDVAGTIRANSVGIITSGFVNAINVGTWDTMGYPAPGSTILSVGGYRSSQWSGVALYGNGVERMRVDNGGNVGIGTSTPTAKLDVNGTVIARGTINAVGGLIIENRTSDPPTPAAGQIWLRTDLP